MEDEKNSKWTTIKIQNGGRKKIQNGRQKIQNEGQKKFKRKTKNSKWETKKIHNGPNYM